MTRKILYGLLMTVGFFVLTSKSCGPVIEVDQEARLKERQDSVLEAIKEDFATEYLFEERLMAYGEKAKQKLFDFADYLSLYSDKDMDTMFRLKARDMASRIFSREDPVVQWSISRAGTGGNEQDRLSDLIDGMDASSYASLKFMLNDVMMIEPLHRVSVGRYEGSLGCSISISGISKRDTVLLHTGNNRVNFIAVPTDKQFGGDTTLVIWQVFLDGVQVTE